MRAFLSFLMMGLVILCSQQPVLAQKTSVNPGINKAFESPNVEEFVGRFESEGRDAFDHRDEINAACHLQPGMKVADIGAGTGLFTRLFSEAVGPQGHVYAVDISDEFIEHLQQTARRENLANVTAVLCTAESVNLPENSIDLAFVCDTYHHFEFPAKTLASIHQALKPEGALILIDFKRIEGVSSAWTLGHVRAGQEVFVKEITDAGFRQVEELPEMLDESYFIRFVKTTAAGK